jgi:hypothetical protein
MTEITINNCNASATMDIVYSLREQGWQQGIDFEFRFYPAGEPKLMDHNLDNGDYTYTVQPAHVIFEFYDSSHATMFALKYTGK